MVHLLKLGSEVLNPSCAALGLAQPAVLELWGARHCPWAPPGTFGGFLVVLPAAPERGYLLGLAAISTKPSLHTPRPPCCPSPSLGGEGNPGKGEAASSLPSLLQPPREVTITELRPTGMVLGHGQGPTMAWGSVSGVAGAPSLMS